MPNALLEARQNALLVTGFDVDDAVGAKADLRDSRRKQIGTCQAPECLSARPRGNSGNE